MRPSFSPARQLTLIGCISVGLALIVKLGQISLTPETLKAISEFSQRAVENLAVQLLLVGTGVLFLLSLCVAAWERMERNYDRRKK